jgi:hypothetical protein
MPSIFFVNLVPSVFSCQHGAMLSAIFFQPSASTIYHFINLVEVPSVCSMNLVQLASVLFQSGAMPSVFSVSLK